LRSKAKSLAVQGFYRFACIGNVCLIHFLSKEKHPQIQQLVFAGLGVL
jgi:hypothetical protein